MHKRWVCPTKDANLLCSILATLKETGKLCTNTKVDSIDFNNIMSRMHELVNHDSAIQSASMEATSNLTWLKKANLPQYPKGIHIHPP
jgi:hypothetical protein